MGNGFKKGRNETCSGALQTKILVLGLLVDGIWLVFFFFFWKSYQEYHNGLGSLEIMLSNGFCAGFVFVWV
jgi:hypothetical protein